jgi:hypothetical protein
MRRALLLAAALGVLATLPTGSALTVERCEDQGKVVGCDVYPLAPDIFGTCVRIDDSPTTWYAVCV